MGFAAERSESACRKILNAKLQHAHVSFTPRNRLTHGTISHAKNVWSVFMWGHLARSSGSSCDLCAHVHALQLPWCRNIAIELTGL